MNRKRIVELTDEQISLLQISLDHWEAAIRDTGYDPQVQEWARTHDTETEKNIGAIREALANSTDSRRHETSPEEDSNG
jgi:hypothetical protein